MDVCVLAAPLATKAPREVKDRLLPALGRKQIIDAAVAAHCSQDGRDPSHTSLYGRGQLWASCVPSEDAYGTRYAVPFGL